MTRTRRKIWAVSLAGFALAMFPTSLFAATPVSFADADLRAFFQLVKPEQTTLRLDGRRGEFRPGAPLRFAGLESQDFEIDLKLGADLVDLRFNNLRAKPPEVAFEADRIRLDFAFEDQSKAIRSALGSISIKGAVLSAWLRFAPDGAPRIEFVNGAIKGEIKGSGLLRAKWVIAAIKSLALKGLKNEVERQLARAGVQDSVEKGLVTWARFSADERLGRIVPRSIAVDPTGLRFAAE